MYKLTADLAPFTPEPTPRRRQSLRRTLLKQQALFLTPSSSGQAALIPQLPATPLAWQANLTPHLLRRDPPRIQRTPEATARLSSVLDDLSALSHELSINLESGCSTNKMADIGGPQQLIGLAKIKENRTDS